MRRPVYAKGGAGGSDQPGTGDGTPSCALVFGQTFGVEQFFPVAAFGQTCGSEQFFPVSALAQTLGSEQFLPVGTLAQTVGVEQFFPVFDLVAAWTAEADSRMSR
jgi:hypothetical protein